MSTDKKPFHEIALDQMQEALNNAARAHFISSSPYAEAGLYRIGDMLKQAELSQEHIPGIVKSIRKMVDQFKNTSPEAHEANVAKKYLEELVEYIEAQAVAKAGADA